MNDFDFHLATRIHFGTDSMKHLADEVKYYGRRVFFLYGARSAKSTGLYSLITDIFKENGIEYREFTGVEPNPRHSTVNRGIAELREYQADCIVAAGGGSLIDCAKAISFGVYHDGDVWDFYSGKAVIDKVMPVIAIPTLAAAGAEVSFSAVISNMDTKQKIGLRNDKMRPACAILDPRLTYSVSAYHTACGVIDIMSHTYETYFCHDKGLLRDGISEAIQRSCIENGRKVLVAPKDYDARAELLWASDLSISHLSACGRPVMQSPIHVLEHILSAYYDIVHGAGIGIVSLGWFKYCLSSDTAGRFSAWAQNVWGITDEPDELKAGAKAIEAYEAFLKELGLPTRLHEVGIERSQIEEIVEGEFEGLKASGCEKWFRPVNDKRDMLSIFEAVL